MQPGGEDGQRDKADDEDDEHDHPAGVGGEPRWEGRSVRVGVRERES